MDAMEESASGAHSGTAQFPLCLLCLLFFLSACATPAGTGRPLNRSTIVCAADAPPLVVLAAREIQRYVYLRSGEVLPIAGGLPERGEAIVIAAESGALAAQQYRLRTATVGERVVLTITGGSPVAALYGAYHFAEKLGVRFYLHGDVIPDERIRFALRDLGALRETEEPLFELRGIQPFHDFTEGPDWWDRDDHKAHLTQLAKLRMNFYGLHCYPEGGVGPEPLVWIGLREDLVAADASAGAGADAGRSKGVVKSSYPSRWASTLGGAWGYAPTKTGDFSAGAGLLFAGDDYGPEVTSGFRPLPATPADENELFRRSGEMLGDVFAHGRALGIKICVGTETPLTIPKALAARLRRRGLDPTDASTVRKLYEGVFRRLAQVSPVDYYWLWTPESWTWSGTKQKQVDATLADISLALEALHNVGKPFDLATCGWVLGPPGDRALFDKRLPKDVAVSCINRQVGFAPVEPGFARVTGRGKWAIPWMEDDPAMIIPQLWAGRMRRDAADARRYGCTGLIGIHWRTKVLAPNIAALAAAAWQPSPRSAERTTRAPGARLAPPVRTADVHVGGNTASFAGHAIADTDEDPVYRTCRWDLRAYHLRVPDGRYTVTLKFCESHYKAAGKRVFGVVLQGEPVVHGLDVFARVGRDQPLDLPFTDVVVDDGKLSIDFVKETEFPFLAGIEIQASGARGGGYKRKINCGGGAWREFVADLPALGAERFPDRPRDLSVGDFYRDWCRAQFGAAVAVELAELFRRLDGGGSRTGSQKTSHLPRPSTWIGGPGGIPPSSLPWAAARRRYAFVDEMAALRRKIRGAGALDRFDYWLDTFRYLRAIGRLSCARGRLDALVKQMIAAGTTEKKRQAARSALAVRAQLARLWEDAMAWQLAVVSTRGEMGTIANLEQHVRRGTHFLDVHDRKIAAALGTTLPRDVEPSREYRGRGRIIVPTKRTQAELGETLTLQVIILDRRRPKRATLHWRTLGRGTYREIELRHVGRAVYSVELPPMTGEGLEYYVQAVTAGDRVLSWPAAATALNQTVVAAPHAR